MSGRCLEEHVPYLVEHTSFLFSVYGFAQVDEEITEQDFILHGYQKKEVGIIPPKLEGPQPTQFCDGIARSFSITDAHQEPGGIGYKKGYTSLGLLIAPKLPLDCSLSRYKGSSF